MVDQQNKKGAHIPCRCNVPHGQQYCLRLLPTLALRSRSARDLKDKLPVVLTVCAHYCILVVRTDGGGPWGAQHPSPVKLAAKTSIFA
jgi:hypothetical protein